MKRKRTIFAIAGVGVIALVGATFAVSQNSTILNNIFGVGSFETTFNEEFESPSNWATCETIDKEFTITNNSNVPAAVRVSLEEQWIAADGTTILPLVSSASNLQMAQINLKDNSGWEKKTGGYYYYDVNLGANESTQTLLTGVTLNCDANLDTDADGAYAGATYHLKIKGEAIQADQIAAWGHIGDCDTNDLYDHVACETNGIDTNVDYKKKATIATGNGNGVNTFAPKASENYPVYYYRGEVYNNNVVWANKCWKIVRTTEAGGIKIIYSGEPDNNQCNATGKNTFINQTTYPFHDIGNSPADLGYMYGDRIETTQFYRVSSDYSNHVFANDIRKEDDGTYTMIGTDDVPLITGKWADKRVQASARNHYICRNRQTYQDPSSCPSSQVGYLLNFGNWSESYYLPLEGYDNIEDAKTAMFKNEHDSNAKIVIEGWFEDNNLDGHISDTRNYENDLEDTVFCNDRSIVIGSLAGKDSDSTPGTSGISLTETSKFSSYMRNHNYQTSNPFEPDIDCHSKRDSFTKNETSTTNGKLGHKIGLITTDELTLAGNNYLGYDASAYLSEGAFAWTMSPLSFGYGKYGSLARWYSNATSSSPYVYLGLRPMVSLKAGTTFADNGADGTKEHPYVIE